MEWERPDYCAIWGRITYRDMGEEGRITYRDMGERGGLHIEIWRGGRITYRDMERWEDYI